MAARRGRKLLDLIDCLPPTALVREAILNDPEQAELIAALPEPEDEWTPRTSEWTLPVALMYDQRALLVRLVYELEAARTGKRPGEIPPLPGPRTAVDDIRARVRANQRRERIDHLMSAFGHRPT